MEANQFDVDYGRWKPMILLFRYHAEQADGRWSQTLTPTLYAIRRGLLPASDLEQYVFPPLTLLSVDRVDPIHFCRMYLWGNDGLLGFLQVEPEISEERDLDGLYDCAIEYERR